MSDQVVIVHKAEPFPGQAIGNCHICITDPSPEYERGDDWAVLEAQFEDDAAALENALRNHLPGGTYDRLLGRMLVHKASHFVVPVRGNVLERVGNLERAVYGDDDEDGAV